MAVKFHKLKIADVAAETSDAVRITFDVPQALADAFLFEPGQYLTLRAEIGGADVRRSYSICSAAGQGLTVGIKRIDGGAFSEFASDLTAGDTLDVMPPQGRFTAAIGGTHNYLLVAAGSGVTPIHSIAQTVLTQEPDSHVTLLFTNRTTESVMFRESMDDLKDRYMTRFSVVHFLTEEAQDIPLFNGRLGAEKLHDLATTGVIAPLEYDAIYMCGPEGMIEAAGDVFRAMGVDVAKLKHERFTSSTPAKPAKAKPIPQGAKVQLIIDGASRQITMSDTQTVITAAEAAGIDLPYSCSNGMCATCRCKLVEGAGDMVQNFSLEPWEVEQGFVLACQFQPSSEKTILDFDAV